MFPSISVVTVNHNTSHFVELMFRSLCHTEALESFDLQITVLDNASSDDFVKPLQEYLQSQAISFVQTGFDNAIAAEKHAAALEDFVAKHKDAEYYFFLDSDIWFVERHTLATMLAELSESSDKSFAVQAQIYGFYANEIIEGKHKESRHWQLSYDEKVYKARLAERCSPVCCLVKNSALFQNLTKEIGFARAIRFGVAKAVYYDTFALMTQAMKLHDFDFKVSTKQVNHFTMTSYDNEGRTIKDKNCLTMLEELREGKGMKHPLFYKSDWLES